MCYEGFTFGVYPVLIRISSIRLINTMMLATLAFSRITRYSVSLKSTSSGARTESIIACLPPICENVSYILITLISKNRSSVLRGMIISSVYISPSYSMIKMVFAFLQFTDFERNIIHHIKQTFQSFQYGGDISRHITSEGI